MATIDQEIKTEFQNEQHRFIANLMFTSNWFQNLFNDFLKPFDISSQQFNVLRILRGAKDWVTMNEIKSLMIEKAPNATRLSDKLLAKGLVERKRSEEDRRIVYLSITQKGLDLLTKIDEQQENKMYEAMGKVTEEEAKLISGVLDRIRS